MSRYVIAALSMALAVGPASALDIGVGANVGGVGVNAGVGLGDKGASVGLGASVGGVAGADVDASVGTGGGSIGLGLGSTGGTGGTAAGGGGATSGTGSSDNGSGASTSAGNGTADSTSKGVSAGGAARSSGTRAVTTVRPLQTLGFPLNPKLPFSLRPHGDSTGWSPPPALVAVSGTPHAVVRACRQAITASARAFGAKDVRAVSAGSLRRLSADVVAAPLVVRIRYAVEDGIEVRQAKIRCHLDASDRVIAVR
jgi:hypothetical protein